MDIYLGACFMFAFLSLAKLAIVKYMRKRVTKRRTHSLVQIASESNIENCMAQKKMTSTATNTSSDGSILIRRNTGIINEHDFYWKAVSHVKKDCKIFAYFIEKHF